MSSIDTWHPVQPGQSHKPALDKARNDLATLAPKDIAMFSGAVYEDLGDDAALNGQFRIRLWNDEYLIRFPDGSIQAEATGEEPRVSIQLILLHYLLTADGARSTGDWIPFRQLPGGNAYEAAFQERAIRHLAGAFGSRPDEVIAAAQSLGGTPLSFGDASFVFQSLPRLSMAIILYRGDDEFPAKANILFDDAAEHYLPTEDLAVLGELLAEHLTGERF